MWGHQRDGTALNCFWSFGAVRGAAALAFAGVLALASVVAALAAALALAGVLALTSMLVRLLVVEARRSG